ncbi:MAG: hypothetical protein WC208_16155 [Gallionella sp.]|jgi:hypothetical protein
MLQFLIDEYLLEYKLPKRRTSVGNWEIEDGMLLLGSTVTNSKYIITVELLYALRVDESGFTLILYPDCKEDLAGYGRGSFNFNSQCVWDKLHLYLIEQ